MTIQTSCYCSKAPITFRCSHAHPSKTGSIPLVNLSCGQKCEKKLGCGNHLCDQICHEGDCAPCEVKYTAKCWCGKEERLLDCGVGERKECIVGEERWEGQFDCGQLCERPFDCGAHRCSKPCHPPSPSPPTCPLSPSLITHCPCGKHTLSPDSADFFPPQSRQQLTRKNCTDPIPTCISLCMKDLEGCSHVCSSRCHGGPCPPCSIPLVRPCRCGSTTREVSCSSIRESDASQEILCDRPCGALRACGRHQCTRLCCPLAALAGGAGKGKGKKRAGAETVVDEAGWHECDLVCGKLLSCGNHRCEEKDHKGPCRSCLRSSFEEVCFFSSCSFIVVDFVDQLLTGITPSVQMICYCGRTVLDPPIPCGTRINCTYPCDRPRLPCGHPKSPHACHEDPTPCPPCVFLTNKTCACGKKSVGNVRCSQERVSCGQVCGKLLGCGFHHCERLCHGDACGACTAVCGKSRKLW